MVYIIIGWIITSILAYGLEFAFWQKRYPEIAEITYKSDVIFSMLMALLGPLYFILMPLFVLFDLYSFEGFKYK